MFLDELAPQKTNSNFKVQSKPIRKEYAAGFKNYHPPQSKQSSQISTETYQEDLFDQLKIGNLKQLYMQSIPAVDNSKQIAEQQKKYMEKLTAVVKKQMPVENDDEQEKLRKAQQESRFMQTYHPVEDYKDRANKVLFQKEYIKMKQKLQEVVKMSPLKLSFDEVFSNFILEKVDKYGGKATIEHDELILDFTNFVNHLRFAPENLKCGSVIKRKNLEQVISKNIFLYGFFDFTRSQYFEIDAQNIIEHIRKEVNSNSQLQWEIIQMLLNKKITVPYECALYQPHQQKSSIIPQKQNQQDAEMNIKFSANPIPKTTYQKPKERPKSQMSKTRPQPFNLTVTNTVIPTVQQVYNWNRATKAKPIPKTTYEPQLFKGNDQDQKRKRALELLHSANYPASMEYLNKYPQVAHKKREELEKKYTKTVTVQQRKHVPNFQLIHKQQMQNLEGAKIQRRNTTQPKPFNLSQGRPMKEASVMPVQEQVVIRRAKPDHTQPVYQPQSTLKFDTYVNHLKKQKQEKLQKQEKKKRDQTKKQQKEKVYKQMLKDRVQCELGRSPKAPFYSNPISSNMVKVNLDKIYGQEPLLMERQAAKSKKSKQPIQKTWQPII